MPSSRFETRAGWLNGRHEELVEALQRALVDGIQIPAQDRDIRILEYPEGAFFPRSGAGPRFSVFEISMIKGRSKEAKARLYAALQHEMAAFGLGERDLKVIIHEPDFENWGIGGKPLDAATIGFKVDV